MLRWLEVIFAKSSSKRGRMVQTLGKVNRGRLKNHLLALCVTIIGKFLGGKCPLSLHYSLGEAAKIINAASSE